MHSNSLKPLFWACLVLILFGIGAEWWWAPIKPGGSLLVLKVLPLAWLLRGLAAGHVKTAQWLSLLILLYVAEGLVRWVSDPPAIAWSGALEALMATGILVACLALLRPLKLQAKRNSPPH